MLAQFLDNGLQFVMTILCIYTIVRVKVMNFRFTNEESCITNEELCIQNDVLFIKNDEFALKMMKFVLKMMNSVCKMMDSSRRFA